MAVEISAKTESSAVVTEAATPPATAIELTGISRHFGEVRALNHVDLAVRRGEFFSLLGPSGCGKTTLLRIVAGLDYPDQGTVRIGGQDMADIPAHLRPVNTVFQSYALFPHLSVWDNIAFGLRMKKVPAAAQATRIDRVMEMVQILPLAYRKPSQLSGGQKQRVALARAIVNEPQVLLLDEPLGALDLKLRKQLQEELHRLQRRLGITFLYVTHDQDEALAMSDRIAVMNHGRIEQLDASRQLYEQPRSRYVAQFLGSCNLLEGNLCASSDSACEAMVQTTVGHLRVCLNHPAPLGSHQKRLTLAIRPEKVQLLPLNGHPPENGVRGLIQDLIYSGAETTCLVKVGEWMCKTCSLNSSGQHQAFRIGQEVTLKLPADGIIILED